MTSVKAPPRPRYVQVAVNAGRPTSLTFSYRVPPGREVRVGEVVHVPWGQRTLQGIVVEGPMDLPGYAGDIRDLEPAVDGAPVSFASLLTVVPVAPAFKISMTMERLVPRLRFPPSAPDMTGVVIVGLVAKTIEPVPVVPLDRSLAAAAAPELTRPFESVVTFVYVPAMPML